jgi:hypothetical protein
MERRGFLCGHDERRWFVGAIPEAASGVVNVRTVRHALQPTLVQPAAAQLRPKPHIMQLVFRRGGTPLYVSRDHPNGLSQASHDALPDDVRRRQSWRQMVRDAEVFATGRITHPDNATLVLHGWHRVLMNTEAGAH